MTNGEFDSRVGQTESPWVIHRNWLWSAIGATLGGLFGHHADAYFWIPEIEWGLLGSLIGFLTVQSIRFISPLEPWTLSRGTITVLLALLFLQGWHSLDGLLIESFPSTRNLFWLFGLLFWPAWAWNLSQTFAPFLVSSGHMEPKPPTSEVFSPSDSPKLLDSSSIIDGRILSLCKTGFLQGRLLVPKCILKELQLLADSHNPGKRIRGKRGLDILSQLRSLPNIAVIIPEDEPQTNLPVDQQLLNLGSSLNGTIITNDWNLAQIASLHGLTILNINELTYELRPLILPGQSIRVFIQKEGQSPGQGAAHLDDGTLIIIDNGSHLIGRSVDVQVSRYMQTNTGRMIFAAVIEAPMAATSS